MQILGYEVPELVVALLGVLLLACVARAVGLVVGGWVFRRRIDPCYERPAATGQTSPLNLAVLAVVFVCIGYGIANYSGVQTLRTTSTSNYFPKADGHELTGKVTHVRDGDTIEVKGVAVRLAALDCAESGTLKGNQATLEMDRLALGKAATCTLNGRRQHDRFIGVCTLDDGTDIQKHMLDEGWCKRYR